MTISTYFDRSIVLIHPRQNKNLGANPQGALYLSANRLAHETWTVELASDDDLVFLRSEHNTLLASRPDGVVVTSASRGASEQWRVEAVPSSELLLLKSAATGMYLSVGDNGVPYTHAQAATDAAQWRIEAACPALKLDGVAAHVALPSMNPDFTQGLTMEAWVRHDALALWSRMFDLGNGAISDNIVLANRAGSADLTFHVYHGATVLSVTAPAALTLGAWTHVAATLDEGGYGRLYKNGVQIAEGQMHLPRNIQRDRNFIGKSNWAVDACLNGQVAEMRLWTYARSPAQLTSAMNRRLHGDEHGLHGYWRLDAPAGLVARDDSGNNRHGSIVGEASWARATGLTLKPPAEEIKVSAFDGTAQIRLPTLDLDFAGGCTIEAWVRPQGPLAWARILEITEGSDHVTLLANAQGNFGILAVASDGATVGKYAPAALPIGRWTHVCGVLDPAGQVRLYADGKLVASGPGQVPRTLPRSTCMIGNSPRGEGYRGMIAELRVWTCARSEAQIAAAMSRGITGHEPGLAGYWKLDEDSGANAQDRSTHDHPGVRVGKCTQVLAHLPIEALRSRVTSVTHEGKVVVFATRPDGRVQYTVKQSGFEDTVAITQGSVPGWELWKDLQLPDQPDDISVTTREARTLTHDLDPARYVLRSRYRTAHQTALVPVQAVSGFGHLNVFRQSTDGTLLLDRFVLDSILNVLVPKVEVRFKRSRKRHDPLLPANKQASDQTFDSLDFSDTTGAPFYEPSTELSLIRDVHDGLFSVVLMPTKDADRQRWHFFVHNATTGKVETVSILSSEAGLFDPLQRTSSADGSPLPGVERTTIDLGPSLQGPVRSLCGVRYDLQEEQASANGERVLLRTAVRVMLVAEAAQGANVLSFAAAADGTLSRIDDKPPAQQVLHSERRELLLPLDTLENVQAAQVTPPVAGTIDAMRRGSGDKVTVQSSTAAKLKIGDSVEVKGTQQYNGRFTVRAVASDTFEIDVSFTDPVGAIGKWEKVSSRETGLLFDGAVTSYTRTPEGKLLVTAPNHGLVVNDAVQITGTSDYNSVYPVSPIDAGQFAIDAPWILGSALSVQRLASRKRRGIVLNGIDESIAVRDAKPPTGAASYTIEAWIRPRSMTAGGVLGWGHDLADNQRNSLCLTPTGLVHRWGNNDLAVATAPLTDGWHHVAATHDAETNIRRIYLDGAELQADQPAGTHAVPASPINFTIGTAHGQHFAGTLADVRVWSTARSAQQIAATMFEPLNGQEDGLCGYWKLGALAEGDAPLRSHKVLDFSPQRSDGDVVGAPHVSNVVLPRVANAQYRNDDMIAVIRGGIYEESVELRAVDGPLPAFKFSHWFKKSSDSPTPDATLAPITPTLVDLGGGWYRATCQFAVPAATSLMRTFKIVDVADGPWTALELRRHRLVELPAAITEWTYSVSPRLQAVSSAPPDLDVKLATLAQNERGELALLLEKRILEDKIAASIDPNLQGRIDAATAEIDALLIERARLTALRAQHEQRPMLFCCRYTPRHSGMALAIENAGQGNGPRLRQVTYQGADHQLFFADPGLNAGVGQAPANLYLIRPKHSGLVVDVEGRSQDNGAMLHQWGYTGHNNQWFLFEPAGIAPNIYKIRSRHSGRLIDVRGATANENEDVLQHHENGDHNQHFHIQRVHESPITQPVLDALNECRGALNSRQQDLELLNAAKLASAGQRDAWQARVNVIHNTLLPPVRAAIETVTAQTLQAIIRDQANAPGLLAVYTEPRRKLATLGGLLPFVHSAGRLTALQTCDGDVQLNYVDSRGRLREARYQATRGSGGAAFDAWRPTAARAGLHLRSGGEMVRFARPFTLGDEWTVESWFQYPLPKVGYCNTLLSRAGAGELMVRDNRLGAWLGAFYDCGFDLSVLTQGWHHLAAVASGDGSTSTITFYIDGVRVGDLRSTAVHRAAGDKARLDAINALDMNPSFDVTSFGNNLGGDKHFGRVAELRLWGLALKDAEVAANSRSLLTGREPGLVAYYPMTDAQGGELRDVTGNGNHGTIVGAAWTALDAPVGRRPGESRGHAVAAAEYDTIGQRPGSTAMIALMRRALAVETPRGVRLLSEQRVEELDLRWVGNAQFQPTLLGYIEGPPPVPSENLTLLPNYNGAAWVELSTSDDVNFLWNRAKDEKFGSTTDFFIGLDAQTKISAGSGFLNFESDLAKLKLGLKMSVGGATGSTRSSTIGALSSLKTTDRLELRGTLEEQPRFPLLGNRFIPKNVGYALVVSGLADVFITSLKRSGRMVGYDVVPNEDIPPDVNTVSFLINPAYTMTGSLDGMTGSKATSERFFGHVPELRAQFGSRYPASYYRLKEAYDLKQQIAEQDKQREAYFFNFDARLTTLGPAGDVELARQIDRGDEPASVGVRREEAQPPADANEAAPPPSAQETAMADAGEQQTDYEEKLAQRRAQIEQSFADREQLYSATRGLDKWQERMEDLRVRAGKRNIVNTYVWDANGGLHAEQQQFANSVQHSVGSNASVAFNFGGTFNFFSAGFGFELTSMFNMQMSQTLTKTVSTSRGFGLGVSLAGVESRGITDHKDRPIVPGEKVGRYRFMSFYLEGATQHFDDFFAYVVDPEWLIGNSENARALRETRGRTNKAWRVLHRVTYVERPALANFGADLRPLPAAPAAPSLDKRVDSVEQKLDLVLKLLQAPKTP